MVFRKHSFAESEKRAVQRSREMRLSTHLAKRGESDKLHGSAGVTARRIGEVAEWSKAPDC